MTIRRFAVSLPEQMESAQLNSAIAANLKEPGCGA